MLLPGASVDVAQAPRCHGPDGDGRLISRPQRAPRARSRPVIAYCASGGRSALLGKTLKEMGYSNVPISAASRAGWRRAETWKNLIAAVVRCLMWRKVG
jgi:rhodanese-related sulfurtransferase